MPKEFTYKQRPTDNSKELDEAIDNFVLELCKEIKIPEFLEWLTNKIESHNKSN